jgi:hypothetical protein
MSTKKAPLFALILVITLAHIGLLSLRFEWPARVSKNKPDFNSGIFTAELGRAQQTGPLTPQIPEKTDDKSTIAPSNETASAPPKNNRRAFSMRSSDEDNPIDAFLLSQKIRQQLLQDEQRTRYLKTEGAIKELEKLLFFQSNSSERNCCKLVVEEDLANCTDPATTLVYKKLANSLMQRIVALSDQGINIICNSGPLN